jgi:hypothetical protein
LTPITLSRPALAFRSPLPVSAPPAKSASAALGEDRCDHRRQFLDQANAFNEQARQAADAGDVSGAARLILMALDCERRAGGLGPQVMQVIKPR